MAVTFRERTLDNGLTIIGETDPAAHTAAVGFFVKTGARDESSDVMGVSHFLEHMMFKGTAKRSADDVNREFDELGASYNAYTSSEITCFYASVLPEVLPQATDILADILRPALRQDDFDTEKNVILEEIAMYKDSPFWVLYEKTMEQYYGSHTLGHRVLGTNETVADLQRDAMQAYFDHRYSADNTVVSLAGNADFDTVCDQINALCGGWTRTGAVRDTTRPGAEPHELVIEDENVSRAYLLTVAPAPALGDAERYAAMMLVKVLGDPDNSRLHWALIDTGIAEEAQASYDPRDGCGEYFVYASGEPDRADEIQSILEREIDALVDSLTEDDLTRLRNKVATAVTIAGERPSGRMQRIGRQWSYLGEHLTLEEELDKINAVTLADLQGVAKAYPFAPRTRARLIPKS